jgi:hypothetical protein
MGVCFQAAGVRTDDWTVTRCWYHPRNHAHFLRAQDLATFFDSGSVVGRTEKYDGKTGLSRILGRTGIVFFQNYWGAGLAGDHIDLLNGYSMKNAHTFPSNYQPGAGGSYERGNIWFWEIR